MMEWKPIETAPKDGTEVLLLVNGRPRISRHIHRETFTNGKPDKLYSFNGWLLDTYGFDKPEPTHWLEIPPAPSSIG